MADEVLGTGAESAIGAEAAGTEEVAGVQGNQEKKIYRR